jgi:pimeloyl-ACP methyl ester carboxylesterase
MRWRGAPDVVLVHGFEGMAAKDCNELAPLAARLRRAARRCVTVVGFYGGDTHADATLPGEPATTNTSLDEIGDRLAHHVREQHPHAPVDLVGHSMGGLVIQAALQQLPAEAVRRVVTLGTPFAGLPSAVGCDVRQCLEMQPGCSWLVTSRARGWRVDLAIGSESDHDVPISSSLSVDAVHRVWVPAARGIDHGMLVTDPALVKLVAATLKP